MPTSIASCPSPFIAFHRRRASAAAIFEKVQISCESSYAQARRHRRHRQRPVGADGIHHSLSFLSPAPTSPICSSFALKAGARSSPSVPRWAQAERISPPACSSKAFVLGVSRRHPSALALAFGALRSRLHGSHRACRAFTKSASISRCCCSRSSPRFLSVWSSACFRFSSIRASACTPASGKADARGTPEPRTPARTQSSGCHPGRSGTVLLICSGLMVRTFRALANVSPGFADPATLENFRIYVPETTIPERKGARTAH